MATLTTGQLYIGKSVCPKNQDVVHGSLGTDSEIGQSNICKTLQKANPMAEVSEKLCPLLRHSRAQEKGCIAVSKPKFSLVCGL